MDKKIEDYLHLYLGCDVTIGNWFPKDYSKKVLESVEPSRKVAAIGFYYYNGETCTTSTRWELPIVDIKPILRQLSDMTEEEANKSDALGSDEINGQLVLSPEAILYLLSKHFDLFGLIESGLAIDKSTLNQTT